jgi:hypothetical protein
MFSRDVADKVVGMWNSLFYRETLGQIDLTGPVFHDVNDIPSALTLFQTHIIRKAPKDPVLQEHGEGLL